jgi:hypothetical protein
MRRMLVAALIAVVLIAVPARGYIHFPPATLPKLCEISSAIRVLKVVKHDKAKGVIVFEEAATLKGKTPDGVRYKHTIGAESKEKKAIFEWLADGKYAVLFTIEWNGIACGYVFIDQFCYSVDYNAKGDYWLLFRVDPEMAATYHGTAETLQKITKQILAGGSPKVPVDETIKVPTIEERGKQVPAINEIFKKNRMK